MDNDILNLLRKWAGQSHIANEILKFEQRGWRHDVVHSWDLFVQADRKGVHLKNVIPALSERTKNPELEGRLRHFYSLCLREMGPDGWAVHHCKSDSCPLDEHGKFVHDEHYRSLQSVYVRCIRTELVMPFRAAVAKRLGL